jgi:Ca2+-binding RTX toxin-like protein
MATIIGTEQSEDLVGTVGDDTITGRGGDDVLTGGDGSDRFVYERLSDLSVWTGSVTDPHETITEFVLQINGGDAVDVLDFSALAGSWGTIPSPRPAEANTGFDR